MVPDLESLNSPWQGNSCRWSWTWKPCWVVKVHVWAQSLIWVMRLCSLSLPSVFTSPQTQLSRPLSLWASLGCPSKKCFLLLGGHFCPWEQTPTLRTWGKGIHSFHISFIILLPQIYFSSCLKSVKIEAGTEKKLILSWCDYIELFLHLLKMHI